MRPPRSTPLLGTTLLLGNALVWTLTACTGDDGDKSGDDSTESGSTEESGDETETGETGEEPDANFVEIPGGTFEMGCSAHTPCKADNPAHSVTLSSFSMEVTEVSAGAYQDCVDAGACTPADTATGCNYGLITTTNHPINCVTWQQAVDYCAWLGRRLPTEAEWEYAASGGNEWPFPWGTADADCTRAHMYEVEGEMGDYGCKTGTTAPVDSYPNSASPFGMLNMAGNVEEWVADWYAADYYQTGPSQDPPGPEAGTQKVHRGGDFYDASPINLRVFERWRTDPNWHGPERGFRCAG
jgi:formylglycine-generating enzyme